MTKNSRITPHALMALSAALFVNTGTLLAAPKKVEAPPLSPEAQQAHDGYASMLESLRSELKPKLPQIDASKHAKLTEAYAAKKVSSNACMEAAKPILADIEGFLTSDSLDAKLVKAAVLADATPRGLAEFTAQGPTEKKLIDDLLGSPTMMKELLLAGGAKAGRYGKAMQIYIEIFSKHPRAKEGQLNRLALAVSLEFAAPELCSYQNIDPIKRYAFFEKSYLEKELSPHFEKHSIWLLRHVVNDPNTEEDMLWMREMLWNYRPEQINAPDEYNAHVVGLMYSEFGHRRAEAGETSPPYSQLEQFMDRGSICGGKGSFGRCLGRAFGIPVWGARLSSHTAMSYWTPKGWETILGVSFENGFWIVDQADPMRGTYFLDIAKSRNFPNEFIKACRADWISSMLGEEKVKGMEPDKAAGTWSTLAVNKRRAIVAVFDPPPAPVKPDPNVPKPENNQGYPERLVKVAVPSALKTVSTDELGGIHLPAVACTSPTTNTKKVMFMTTRDGGMNLHYKRWEMPEPLIYGIEVPAAGNYELIANVVTVNRDQFFLVTTNDAEEPVRLEMPYTVGKWETTAPVTVSLRKGMNKISFNRTVIPDFIKEGYKFAGPEYGGITIKDFVLKPVK
jgi:hypothetical protein